MKAATLLEPKVQRVRLSSGTLKDENDVRTWLEDAEQELLATLKKGLSSLARSTRRGSWGIDKCSFID